MGKLGVVGIADKLGQGSDVRTFYVDIYNDAPKRSTSRVGPVTRSDRWMIIVAVYAWSGLAYWGRRVRSDHVLEVLRIRLVVNIFAALKFR